MGYPDPCAECGGTEEHALAPWCPAMSRGAGSRRDLCGTVYPSNRGFDRCRKPKGHEERDPFCVFTLGLSTGQDWRREVLFQDAEHPRSVEMQPTPGGHGATTT